MFSGNSGQLVDFSKAGNIVCLALLVVIFGILDLFIFNVCKKGRSLVVELFFQIAFILSWLFTLEPLFVLFAVANAVAIIFIFYWNLAQFRVVFKDKSKRLFAKKKLEPMKFFDRDELFDKITQTVISLSKQKVGALITFERGDKFDEIVKSGTILNSPITPELLQTIFYPGTRLHDGAVVIRDNSILAASVYFTPTTKPLTGKYGSRHRAAIGISESTDSVTIVVSEETGRISIAFNGELEHVTSDILKQSLETFMNTKKEEE